MQRTHNSYTSEFKLNMVNRYYDQSCPPIRNFCLENNIPKNTFYDWLVKYRNYSHIDNNHRKEIVDEYLNSNISIKEFCIQNDLKEPTFYTWLRKYRETDDVTESNEVIEITSPIKELAATANINSTFSLDFNGYKMTFNISDLKIVIKALQK